MAFTLGNLENGLLACLCAMLAAEGRPVCVCHFYAGDTRPPADRCQSNNIGGNGQAWLRRDVSVLRTSNTLPTFGGGTCSSGSWQTTIELGIYRCISAVPGEKGQAPTPEQYLDDRTMFNADKQTLYQVLCCDAWDDPTLQVSVVNASIDPIGPSGACGGSVLQITVEGDPTDTDGAAQELLMTVTGDPADPTGMTALAAWTVQGPFVSGPAGAEEDTTSQWFR